MLSIYTHPIFQRHDTGAGHPESAARMDFAADGVRRAGLASRVVDAAELHPETDRIIAKVHSADYEQAFEEAVERGFPIFQSGDNTLSPGTFDAARAAVGTALRAADDVWNGDAASRAFVIARPPGHHAERLSAMGFCFFNTIACVAERLRERPGIERVFILDFDVHHGNGTQALFEERADVFYASTHRYPFYPGTGAANEIGSSAGRGFTKNIPLRAGDGDSPFLRAIEEQIVAAIDDYRPQALLLSAGFDAHRRDPLGGMRVTEEAYGTLTQRMVEAAERHCDGRLLSLLEGGYDPEGLTASVSHHVTALA